MLRLLPRRWLRLERILLLDHGGTPVVRVVEDRCYLAFSAGSNPRHSQRRAFLRMALALRARQEDGRRCNKLGATFFAFIQPAAVRISLRSIESRL